MRVADLASRPAHPVDARLAVWFVVGEFLLVAFMWPFALGMAVGTAGGGRSR